MRSSKSARRVRRFYRVPLLVEGLESRVVPSFLPPRAFDVGRRPVSVAARDVNGDGRLDLAVVNRYSYSVSVLLGNGDGSFQAARDLASGYDSRPRSVVVRDVDGDGQLDLAVDKDNSDVSVFVGNGDGTFQAARRVASFFITIESFAVVDVNGDGRLDLAAAGYVRTCWPPPCRTVLQTVRVLLGNGDGTFQQRRDSHLGSMPRNMRVGDVNGDGRLDVVVTLPASNHVSVLLGNGDGFFQAARNVDVRISPYSVTAADVNGDGRLDVVVGLPAINHVSVLLGNGDGTFQMGRLFAAGSQTASLTAADVNGDGRLDLITTNRASDNVSVLLGNGDGSFQAAQHFAAGIGPNSVTAADVNGDGRLDLAVTNEPRDTVSILLNDTGCRPPRSGRFTCQPVGDAVPVPVRRSPFGGPGGAPGGGSAPGEDSAMAMPDLLVAAALERPLPAVVPVEQPTLLAVGPPAPQAAAAPVEAARPTAPALGADRAGTIPRQVVDQLFAVPLDFLTHPLPVWS